MASRLTISAEWERLDEGAAEERACFAAIGIWRNDTSLTPAHDSFVNVVRKTPYLSGYHLAEWITWNWWRLRWEPRTSASDWAFAHRLSTIGGGYVWPDITIFSDGERTALVPRPTAERPSTAYRYIGDVVAVFPSREYEAAVDRFIESVRGRLRAEGVAETNLDVLWRDLSKERQDASIAQRRKFEALLGREPDAADDKVLRQLETDSKELGQSASQELAAHHDSHPELLSAETLRQQAARHGFDIDIRDGYRLPSGTHRFEREQSSAWYLGAKMAASVREDTRMNGGPIDDAKLLQIMAVRGDALDEDATDSRISFLLDQDGSRRRIVFRSKWRTGRRFELARLLGDRLLSDENDRLYPATRASTYRQKAQRSFAAEFLSPFKEIEHELGGDFSVEAQQEIAEHFQVSPLVVRTLLVNHGRLDRAELDEDPAFVEEDGTAVATAHYGRPDTPRWGPLARRPAAG